jgi:hypothetical protein
MVQLTNTTAGRNSRFYVINSSPGRDQLAVRGLGGADTLKVSAGTVDVSSLIAVTLDGNGGNDTLISTFDNVALQGGADTDSVHIEPDGKTVDGATALQLYAGELRVSRTVGGATVEDRLTLAGVENLTLALGSAGSGSALGSAGSGSDLRVIGTPTGTVRIESGAGNNTLAIEGLNGATTLALGGRANTVTVGKDGSLAGIKANFDVKGGSGADAVVFDGSAEVADQSVTVDASGLTSTLSPGLLTYDAAVDSVELRLGRGADNVIVPGLSRRVTVDGGGGADRVQATLLGAPLGTAAAAGLVTHNVEQVDFTNDQTAPSTDWLLTSNQLRAGMPGVLNPLAAGFYDQVVLQTAGASQVNLSLGDGVDHLRVWDLATATKVDLRGGADAVVIGDARLGPC